jgi:ATP-dependent helicase YprA (DUF1998 family)
MRLLNVLIHLGMRPLTFDTPSRHIPDADAGHRQEADDPQPWRWQDEALLVTKLHEIAEGKFPFLPQDWQLWLAVTLIKGQSCILIAGTGQGKSLPFGLPSLVTGKMALVLSPLNALEEDQVCVML